MDVALITGAAFVANVVESYLGAALQARARACAAARAGARALARASVPRALRLTAWNAACRCRCRQGRVAWLTNDWVNVIQISLAAGLAVAGKHLLAAAA